MNKNCKSERYLNLSIALMKKLLVPYLDIRKAPGDIEQVSLLLDTLPGITIANQPWPEFTNKIQASFSIAHTGEAILLKYNVTEEALKVATFETNGAVHKDNCVEFFVSFGDEESYYNIEMNCIGVGLIAYGSARFNRTFIPKKLVEQIQTYIKIKTVPDKNNTSYTWEITLGIPIGVFLYSDLKTFSNKTAQGNFFKCGDDLPQPHFYSWNMIHAATPDFHLPEFFGALTFE